MAKFYGDLKVWRSAMDVAVATYRLTATFPQYEQYGLCSQLRRSAVSIPSNIAEGSGRESRKDFRQFVLIARGSTCELQTQLLLAARLGYCTGLQADELLQRVNEVGRMLNGLAAFLKKHPNARPAQHQSQTTSH
jgi:four helix bundle protein